MKINNKKGFWHLGALQLDGVVHRGLPIAAHHIHHFFHAKAGAYSKTVFSGAGIGPMIMLGLIGTVIVLNAADWDKAKANHTEAIYQSTPDGVQKFFRTLGPGNTPIVVNKAGSGYWEGRVLAGK